MSSYEYERSARPPAPRRDAARPADPGSAQSQDQRSRDAGAAARLVAYGAAGANQMAGERARLASRGHSEVPRDRPGATAAALRRLHEWVASRDGVAQRLGGADYGDYVSRILVGGGPVLGRMIPPEFPVHPVFLEKLLAASAAAEQAIRQAEPQARRVNFGVRGLRGQQNRPGNHAWGLAVDIDADTNPYIANEAADRGVDDRTAPIYERIATVLLHRPSLITHSGPHERTRLAGASYEQVAEENDAMIAYFSVLAEASTATPRWMSQWRPTPADLAGIDRDQAQQDFDVLSGRQLVENRNGVPTPVALTPATRRDLGISGDFPFEGGGPARTPSRGFLTLRREIVEALRAQHLRWGATEFGSACGDVMHFDDAEPGGQPRREYFEIADRYRTQAAPAPT